MGTRKSQSAETRMARANQHARAADHATREADGGMRPRELMQLALGFGAPPAGAPLAVRPAHLAPAATDSRAPKQTRDRSGNPATTTMPARADRSGPLNKHATPTTLSAARHPLSPTPAGAGATRDAPSKDRERPGPVTDAASMQRHFGELREALDEGWEIVQPIFARPLWSAPDDSATAFNFVLRSPRGTRLITVPQGRPVERFIRDRRLTVDYAR